jgi:hypothetical protein
MAVAGGAEDVVDLLLKAGADPNAGAEAFEASLLRGNQSTRPLQRRRAGCTVLHTLVTFSRPARKHLRQAPGAGAMEL